MHLFLIILRMEMHSLIKSNQNNKRGYRKHSLFPNATVDWNNLIAEVATASQVWNNSDPDLASLFLLLFFFLFLFFPFYFSHPPS